MPNRRKILGYLLSSSIGASLLTIIYPIVRFLIPPSNPEAAALSVVAAKSDELPVLLQASVVEPFPLRQNLTWRGLKSNLENPAATIIKTNKKRVIR